MAESLAHKFGQIIGELLEKAIEPNLYEFAELRNLYLDKKGIRLARKGKKLSWTDGMNNVHDLDFVLEKNGAEGKIGDPVAFIEIAWRRYTKHSRNKAQEIQGAILPLAEKYKNSSPFKGVVLAGIFTEGAITQLKSSGFCVLYFPYETVIESFKAFGIDASFDEKTTEEDFKVKIDNWENLKNKSDVSKLLLEVNKKEVIDFFRALDKSVTRDIENIVILPLYGESNMSNNINEAIAFITKYSYQEIELPFNKYEIIIKYNTGDKIDASFYEKIDAINFLKTYL